MTTRALTILNDCGDQTIVWDESSDERMTEIIRKKMEQGVIFFVVEPRFFGLLPAKKTELKNADDARKHRALSIRDEDLQAFVSDGAGEVTKTPPAQVKTVRKATKPEEVAKAESVAVKPMKGG